MDSLGKKHVRTKKHVFTCFSNKSVQYLRNTFETTYFFTIVLTYNKLKKDEQSD